MNDCAVHADLAGQPALRSRPAEPPELGEYGAFPAPARLAQLTAQQRGLTERKIDQLRGVAMAAQEGAPARQTAEARRSM